MLLLAALPQAAPPAEALSDIVVIGQRLKYWHGKFDVHDGKARCRTTRSTGDREIDAIGCEAMMTCYAPLIPQVDAIAARAADKAVRKREVDALMHSRVDCLAKTHEAGIARLAATRRGQ